jgi:hypothetical protein
MKLEKCYFNDNERFFFSRFLETIYNLTSVLRPYWKCLQSLNDEDKSVDLNTYLDDWDKTNRAGINFYSYENPPKPFQLTGFYPLWTDEENARLDKEIDQLIANTDLSVPAGRICLGLTAAEGLAGLDKETVAKCVPVELNSNENSDLDSGFRAVAFQIANKNVNKYFDS